MPVTHFCVLPEPSRPLLSKFYREHKSPMRPTSDAQLWVAKQSEIVGALCLTAVANGHLLTGLFVAPLLRGQNIASDLIQEAVAQAVGPVWLFCHPDLLSFYQRGGFHVVSTLPEALADRFQRYSRTKSLIAMSKPSGPL
ncbi:GNAT family N-acetyltransferase [Pseudomonas sp. CCI1.2]|uniref:GNAT family N-acetyltransferase n=1 Tax=Pseudomonas sp. CCI1.2 TaxID=3048614 RepID=UPI002B2294F0|nr:GNAT family N-acetyltransferase [Pseudomonas sp. CCI1.2]MEB0122133.1 GNAT family N-acetyltransferase [Pseudomonas sp. CCI1.2]